ncbi:MAG: hypothetical protein GXP27_09015, partial [Planctomycetes bacterium]|nr:hypothetical protein [Planctomycetota bacterium]
YFPSYSAFHRPSVVARRGDWKLIHLLESGEDELYRTDKDIGERHNVADEHPEMVRQLRASIEQWMKDANVPHMKPNPEYDPNWRRNRNRQPNRSTRSARS